MDFWREKWRLEKQGRMGGVGDDRTAVPNFLEEHKKNCDLTNRFSDIWFCVGKEFDEKLHMVWASVIREAIRLQRYGLAGIDSWE
ncbi:putative Fanconi anemia group B protein [Sesbania bispinosa]|nr:putative Fanconi anemia group B protein [Sesbania bispinosa]